jgi:RNA polymerase sigma-70 factor (ECF subfamily)
MQTASDGELVMALGGNDRDAALGECIRRYGSMIMRTAWRITGDEQEAEDVCQAVLLVLLRKAAGLKQTELLGAWLYRVTILAARKMVQGRGRRFQREREAALSAQAQRRPAFSLPTGIDKAIDRLPKIYRQVIVAHYLEGRSHAEVASKLGVNEQTVRKRASLGLDRLRKSLMATAPSLTVAALAHGFAGEAAASAGSGGLTTAQAAALQTCVIAKATAPTSLAQSVLNAMLWAKAKMLGAVGVAAVATMVGVLALVKPDPVPLVLVLADFNGPTVPVNKAGKTYPSYFFDPKDTTDAGGIFTSSIDRQDAVLGNSLRLRLTQGLLKAQFNPYSKERRGFAREYVADPTAWQFNTYNRLTLWMKLPPPVEGQPYRVNGEASVTIGTYCKRVTDAHEGNDNVGGGHFYHRVNVPSIGRWAQVVLNMHPHFEDGKDFGEEIGIKAHPSGEEAYNYFDTLTRFFISVRSPPASYPADYSLDEIRFEQQPGTENDEQVYSIAAAHDPQKNRVIVTWSRRKDEAGIGHEVRYAFRDIHTLDWGAATLAPKGTVAAASNGSANGMVYDTTELPLSGHTVLYVAIKPQNSEKFSQIAIPLNLK